MIRGLHAKWKQSVAYFLTHNTVQTADLASLITECIERVEQTGLNIRCIVCDQAATNTAAVKQLGFTESNPKLTAVVSSKQIHVIFDVPHIVKNVRNNFQNHDVKIGDNSQLERCCSIL
jgi:Transposase protein